MAKRPPNTMPLSKLKDGHCFQLFENRLDPAAADWRWRKAVWTRGRGSIIRNPGGVQFDARDALDMLVKKTSCRRRR